MSPTAATKRDERFSSKSRRGAGTGGGRRCALRGGNAHEPALAVSREGQARADVLAGQLRKVGEDLGLTHPAGEVGQDVPDGEPGASDARLAEADLGVDDDAGAVVHAGMLRPWAAR